LKNLTSPPQPPSADLHPRCEQDGYGGPSKVHTPKIAARDLHCEYGKSLSLVLYFAWVWYYRTASYLLRLIDHFRLLVLRLPLLSIDIEVEPYRALERAQVKSVETRARSYFRPIGGSKSSLQTGSMEQSLIAPQPEGQAQALVSVQDAHDKAREFVQNAKASSTVRAYRGDWRDFETWCSLSGLTSLPAAPETVALYLAARGDTLKPATLGRRLAAIAKAHQSAGHDSPCSMRHAAVSEVLKGIRRTKGSAQSRKAPIPGTRRSEEVSRAISNGLH
jgi:Phage integrase, N-terminal SAM-like domain